MPNGGQINNEGTFRKSDGDGESMIGYRVAFHNTGTVEVDSGTLAFGGGGSSEDATVTFENGGRVRFSDEYDNYTANSSRVNLYGQTAVMGNGTLEVDGAALMAPSDTVATMRTSGEATVDVSDGRLGADAGGTLTLETSGNGKVMLTGGYVGGPGDVINQANFEWTGGRVSGNLLNESPNFEITGTTYKGVGYLKNAGTIVDSSTGLGFGSGSQLTNLAGGLYDLQGDGHVFRGSMPNGGQINNEGTFRKSGGDGESVIGPRVGFHNTGTVEVDSGTLAFAGGYSQTAGATMLNGGTITSTTRMNIYSGTIEGTGTIEADILNHGGLVSPGFSPGMLTIEGDYTQGSEAMLLLEMAGLGFGEYDIFNITGTATLGGYLEIDFLNDFRPTLGDSFDFLNYASCIGQFDSIFVRGFPGYAFAPTYGPTGLTLETSTVPMPSSVFLAALGLLTSFRAMYRQKNR